MSEFRLFSTIPHPSETFHRRYRRHSDVVRIGMADYVIGFLFEFFSPILYEIGKLIPSKLDKIFPRRVAILNQFLNSGLCGLILFLSRIFR